MLETTIPAWPGLTPVRRLAGGARNAVWLAQLANRTVVIRRSTRPQAALEWEFDLLRHLDRNGIAVPLPIQTADGRDHVDGVHVIDHIDGAPPKSTADWHAVVATLKRLHECTTGWPQRPTFAGSTELMTTARGGDVRLDLMDDPTVEVIRAAWLPLADGPVCVVHGDIGTGNLLINERVHIIDWDESRVDSGWFDHAHIPDTVPVPVPVDRETLRTAGLAWEVATCWGVEPDYARRQLEVLLRRVG